MGACIAIGGENSPDWGVLSESCPYTKAKAPHVRWAVSRPGRQLSRRRQMESVPASFGVEQLKRPLLLLEPSRRQTLPSDGPRGPPFRVNSPWGWAVFSCSGVGCLLRFGAPLALLA